MSPVTLFEESRELAEGFYVPQFEIRIEGVGLPRDVLRDVTSFTYKDNVKEIDSFELTINNWDSAARAFKYIGSETEESMEDGSEEATRYRLFEPCNKTVEVRLGYVGYERLNLMMTGQFTTMEPNFPSSGAPTLNVRGLNVLHQLRRKQYTHAWTDTKDSDIALDIQNLRDEGRRRFPLPIVINEEARSQEEAINYVAQNNQYDIDFLLNRARQLGYVVYIQEEDEEQGTPRQLYFGPSDNPEEPVSYELTWGKSLVDFKPTLTTANQIKSVTVNGWDRARRRPIRETVTLDDRRLTANQDLREILQVCDPREEYVVNEPVFTRAQARQRARDLLMDRTKGLIKATGSTVGLPNLRAGRRAVITGVGSRLSGTYFVTETTHTVNDSGYTTRFSARREETDTGAAA